MLTKVLDGVKTVAIGGHIRPDGDCVGSCLGMYLYLTKVYPEVKVDVYLQRFSKTFGFLQRIEDIKHEVTGEKEYDLFISLDCGDRERLGFTLPLFDKAKRTLCIDHHESNNAFADVNYIYPEASSTAELVYDLLDKDEIDTGIAQAIYLGIVHDTGVFQYSNVAPSTFQAAAFLITKEIDAPRIISETFYAKTYAQNQILGRTLLESFLLLEGKVIAGSVSRRVMDFYGVNPGDFEGIVSQMRVTEGVEVAIFMYELEPGNFKVSLRSKDIVDVNRIAAYFGGGGHKKAAGFNMAGTAHDITNNVTKFVAEQLKELEGNASD
ncbi:bifunctional oligoribonuclease/PAP phosphatase NrnA [Lachnospiraceae bacterium OttesenSCG-928-J05]|nr:bifunctional oligoribonuclease/PAP phosphatase NrnA [Lachnospiraceae bacterium OttesenSCG-928-J05]